MYTGIFMPEPPALHVSGNQEDRNYGNHGREGEGGLKIACQAHSFMMTQDVGHCHCGLSRPRGTEEDSNTGGAYYNEMDPCGSATLPVFLREHRCFSALSSVKRLL